MPRYTGRELVKHCAERKTDVESVAATTEFWKRARACTNGPMNAGRIQYSTNSEMPTVNAWSRAMRLDLPVCDN